MTELREVWILDAVRTPIGRHRGVLSAVRPDDLLASVIQKALERTKIDGAQVDEAIMGCANQAGEDNRNVARMALLLAGLPASVPGVTVNRLCASGLEAVNQGARQIATGEAEIVLAGGVESMTRAPMVLSKGSTGFEGGNRTAYDTSLGWRFPNPRLEALFPLESMGETAENLVEKYGITREAQDMFAYMSHKKAIEAERDKRFKRERMGVTIATKDGEISVEADEGPRPDASVEKLRTLRPAFRKNGTVTAGNASSLNDGAACVVLASAKATATVGATPLARWCGGQSVGVDPRYMGIGPVLAIQRLLARFGLSHWDLDLVELNEAFSAQVLAVFAELGVKPEWKERVNVNGGAIALGHPLGASGARILATLVHEMQRRRARRGLASLCVGVGQGVATLVEAP